MRKAKRILCGGVLVDDGEEIGEVQRADRYASTSAASSGVKGRESKNEMREELVSELIRVWRAVRRL